MRITNLNFKKIIPVLILGCLALLLLWYGWPMVKAFRDAPQNTPPIRGAWVHARSVKTPEKADQVLNRLEAGNFNAMFVNVFVYGHAFYNSSVLKKHPDLAQDYDPLAYLIKEAHRRGIAVHAWLVAGPVGFQGEPGPILTQHPEWAMVGPDGQPRYWLNYTRPDVEQFIGDVVVELVKNYALDGVHFDYLRYPGPAWSFDPASTGLFAQTYGANLQLLRYKDLPAYARFRGNPLVGVNTAQVLARFENGRPAVLLNSYGAGQVITLNWYAVDRQVAAASEIMRRSLNYLLEENGQVYILHSETNAKRYGWKTFNQTVNWLKDLNRPPIPVEETELTGLKPKQVLVLPGVYLVGDTQAAALAGFVKAGGSIIFIDGPTPSIHNKNIQAITGMRSSGRHFFQEPNLLIAAADHPIIPASNRKLTLSDYQALDAQWKSFRKQGLNNVLQNVYRRAKQANPAVQISVTVGANQETLADDVLIDWQTWLNEGYIDLLIPRAYVNQNDPLEPVLAEWQPTINSAAGSPTQVAIGLQSYVNSYGSQAKPPERLLLEIDSVLNSGAAGFILFDLQHIDDEGLKALSNSARSASEPTESHLFKNGGTDYAAH